MNIHFHHHYPEGCDPRWDQLLAGIVLITGRLNAIESGNSANATLLSLLNTKVNAIMVTLADIQSAETDESTAITSVLAEINQLETDLASAQASGADQTTIQNIIDEIHANTAKLKAVLPPASTPPTSATISGAAGTGDTGATGAAAGDTGVTGTTGA